MKTKNYSFALLITVMSLLTFSSCKTEDVEISTETLTLTSNDEAQASKINDEITAESDIYVSALESTGYDGYDGVKGLEANSVSNHPIVTVDKPDSINFPKVITIDFGTAGFINHRGDTIKGKLTITITGKMYIANSSRTIAFTNFSINNNVVAGTKSVTYKGLNINKNHYWLISADLAFTFSDGKTMTWKSERTRERISNNNTPKIMWDDTYSLKGTASGVNLKGNNYSIVIDDNNPLILIGGFPFFVKGIKTTTVKTKVAIIDFGDGTKDNKATITINGVTKEITLKR